MSLRTARLEPTTGPRKQTARSFIACASGVLRLHPACPIVIGSARNKGRNAAMAATFAIVSDAAGCLSADPGSRRNFIAMAAFSGYFFGLCKVSLRGRRFWGLCRRGRDAYPPIRGVAEFSLQWPRFGGIFSAYARYRWGGGGGGCSIPPASNGPL